jgi:hypothetical protein
VEYVVASEEEHQVLSIFDGSKHQAKEDCPREDLLSPLYRIEWHSGEPSLEGWAQYYRYPLVLA